MNIVHDGCGFGGHVANLSFDEFKKEFEHSYLVGKSDKQAKDAYEAIKKAVKENGNPSNDKEEIIKP